jgi:NAD(P)-dependent dehydrogenase (short-subunit alcohol dehydrogenase family)
MSSSSSTGVHGRTVVLAGGTSDAGFFAATALAAAGARVVVMGRDAEKLVKAKSLDPRIATAQADLTEEEEVFALADPCGSDSALSMDCCTLSRGGAEGVASSAAGRNGSS